MEIGGEKEEDNSRSGLGVGQAGCGMCLFWQLQDIALARADSQCCSVAVCVCLCVLVCRHGRATFSVLLFQDLAVVVLLMLIPLLAPDPSGASTGMAKIAQVCVCVCMVWPVLGCKQTVVAVGRVPDVLTSPDCLLTYMSCPFCFCSRPTLSLPFPYLPTVHRPLVLQR